MTLILSEEQAFLKDTAKKFAQEKTPTTHFRQIRDTENPECFDRNVWQEMAAQGWSGILIPEKYGGSNFGLAGIGVVLEELGRTLTPSPLFATSVVCATLLNKSGNESQKKEYLTKIASGEITMAFALEEGPRHQPSSIKLEAQKDKDTFVLNGKKNFVIDGGFANYIIVAAKTSDNVDESSLFILDKKTEGLNIIPTVMVDHKNSANIEFNNVVATAENLLGNENAAKEIIDETLDIARAALSAEMLGGALEAFDITLNYLKEREQFGEKIGSFQALQHRAALMFTELELCKSCVIEALTAFDEGSNDLQRIASLAKSKMGETFFNVSNEGVQMHGGVGVTDEYDIGLYMKRARVAEQTFGNTEYHRNRYAELTGY
ncbi:MAG: acyl-CoA dehydrogenase family protein [Gammaproteobacteria bacterium]|nr:MAG: acyl-CoA dehydrogenase family protein [Gammaproteobacteria bacterium]